MLKLLIVLGVVALLVGCEQLFPKGPVSVPIISADGRSTNYVTIPNGTTIGPAIPATGETAKLFGPYGELAAALLALGAATYAKVSNQKALNEHIKKEHPPAG